MAGQFPPWRAGTYFPSRTKPHSTVTGGYCETLLEMNSVGAITTVEVVLRRLVAPLGLRSKL